MKNNIAENPVMGDSELEKFRDWLRSSHTAFISIISIAAAIIGNGFLLFSKINDLKKTPPEDIDSSLELINFGFQCILLSAIYFYYSKLKFPLNIDITRVTKYISKLRTEKDAPLDEKRLKYIGILNTSLFNRYWRSFWLVMITLYISFIFSHLTISKGFVLEDNVLVKLIFEGIEIFLNNLGAVYLFMCFRTLYDPIQWNNENWRMAEAKNNLRATFFPLVIIVFAISLAYVIIMLNTVCLDCMKCDATKNAFEHYGSWFKSLSGVLNAVAISLLIGRLDSKIIHIRTWLISILYCYAAVQPLYGFFSNVGGDESIKHAVLYLVLAFKIHFFLIIRFAIDTNRLSDYLIVYPYMQRMVENFGWKKADISK